MPAVVLQEVSRTTTMARLLQVVPAWWGFANAADLFQIDRFRQRAVKMGYLTHSRRYAQTLVMDAENRLLTAVSQH